MKRTLEVIAVNYDDFVVLQKFASQLDSVEYCINLAHGGTTPLYADVKKVNDANFSLRTHLMLRDSNNDCASLTTISNLQKQLIDFKALPNIHGYVFGFLTECVPPDNVKWPIINMPVTTDFADLITPLTSVFHRAFDKINPVDKVEVLHQLANIGISTVLMSGTKANIVDNIDELVALQNTNTCKILCGGGVNFKNIDKLVAAGLKHFHVGSCVRVDNKFENPIDVDLLSNFIKHISV